MIKPLNTDKEQIDFSFLKNSEVCSWDRKAVTPDIIIIQTINGEAGKQFTYAVRQTNGRWVWLLNDFASTFDFDGWEGESYETVDECLRGLLEFFDTPKDM